jgi:hypothetical protein
MSIKKTNSSRALSTECRIKFWKWIIIRKTANGFKYHLSKIAKIAADENTSVDSLRDDAIRSGECNTQKEDLQSSIYWCRG